MVGKRKAETGQPKQTKVNQRSGVPSNFPHDWFDMLFAGGVLVECRSFDWETHHKLATGKKFQALEGYRAYEAAMLIGRRHRLATRFGKLTDGLNYWVGKLTGLACISCIMVANQAAVCAKELLQLADGTRECVNLSQFSLAFFDTVPAWNSFTARLHAGL